MRFSSLKKLVKILLVNVRETICLQVSFDVVSCHALYIIENCFEHIIRLFKWNRNSNRIWYFLDDSSVMWLSVELLAVHDEYVICVQDSRLVL